MDVFKIMSSDQQPKQPEKQPKQQPKPTPQKSFMQQAIEEGKEDLSNFDLAPMRRFISKSKLKKQMEVHIKRIYSDYDTMDFFYDIKIALHKKLDMTKVEVSLDGRRFSDNGKKLNMLEFLMLDFHKNPKQHMLFAKYLFVNEPKFNDKKYVDRCLYLLMQEDPYKTRQLVLECNNNFLRMYKLLIEKGAKSMDVVGALFDSRGDLYNYNVNLIELLLYENDPELTKKVLNSFYTCPNPKHFYSILQRYDLKPNLDDAVARLIYQDGEYVVNYLVESGVFKRQDITEERVKKALAQKGVNNPEVIQRAVDRANMIRQGLTKQEYNPEKPKVSTKQTLKATQEIDKIFEDALKNTESTK